MPSLIPELVVDTNVVVKFFFREEDADKAQEILQAFRAGRVQLIAPDFMLLEFVNIVWLKTRNGECSRTEAEQKIAALLHLTPEMRLAASGALLAGAFQAACDYNHAAYDTAFLALSKLQAARFVTADARLYNKIRSDFPSAVLLRNWSPA